MPDGLYLAEVGYPENFAVPAPHLGSMPWSAVWAGTTTMNRSQNTSIARASSCADCRRWRTCSTPSRSAPTRSASCSIAKSPRSVSVAQAVELTRHVPPLVSSVGLFVNASPDWIREVTSQRRLSLLQFHGDETPEQCARTRRQLRVCPGGARCVLRPDTTAADLVKSSLQLFSSQWSSARRTCRRLWRRWKGIRLVTYPNRSRASGRFEWWVERSKRP